MLFFSAPELESLNTVSPFSLFEETPFGLICHLGVRTYFSSEKSIYFKLHIYIVEKSFKFDPVKQVYVIT